MFNSNAEVLNTLVCQSHVIPPLFRSTLGYNENDTFFHIPAPSSTPVRRAVSLTNTFTFPVILHKLELHDDAGSYYTVCCALCLLKRNVTSSSPVPFCISRRRSVCSKSWVLPGACHYPSEAFAQYFLKQTILLFLRAFSFAVTLRSLRRPPRACIFTFCQISNFSSPVFISPQETTPTFEIECHPAAVHALNKKSDGHISVMHQLILHTNASAFLLPLQAFTGFLKVSATVVH